VSAEAEVAKIVERNSRTRLVAANVARAEPDNARAQAAVADAFALSGEHKLALQYFLRAAALAPDNAPILVSLGDAQQNLGDFGAAKASFRRAIALDPDNPEPYYLLTRIEKQTLANNWIPALERIFTLPDPDGLRTLRAGHALAKSFEDFGDLEASFAWLGKAKAARGRLRPYDLQAERKVAEAAMMLAAGAANGNSSEEPIFVVGLPRTGTSLVDRIISSHPSVLSAGELNNLSQLMKAMAQTPGDLSLDVMTLRAAGKLALARLGKAYVDSTRPVTGERPRFIDKAPINYLLAGLIHRTLPNARIVCLMRDPMDACLSLYRQMFPTDKPYYDFVYRLDHTARAYALFRRVAAHWRETLPANRYIEVSYEAVVDDLEGQARRLIDFCGLAWDDRCLSFHENESAIATPSAAQVRQPIYRSSVGRWRAYGPLMDKARETLAREGIGVAD
jgi:tetratricopeptide (TPR) repeat protein